MSLSTTSIQPKVHIPKYSTPPKAANFGDLLKNPAKTASNNPAGASTNAAGASKRMPAYYNNIFQFSGRYTGYITSPRIQKVEVRWEQIPFKKGVKYPPGSKAVRVTIYINGVAQKGSLSSYIAKNGVVWANFRAANGAIQRILSPVTVFTPNMQMLLKAINQIKREDEYVRLQSLRKLPFAIRNKSGRIVATTGTLMLATLIRDMGVRNVAYKTSPLAAKVFDNIGRLLNLKGMGKIVHHVVDHTGLRVNTHPTRGRRLQPGQSQAGPSVTQQTSIAGILRSMPALPWQETIRTITTRAADGATQATEAQVDTLIANMLVRLVQEDGRRAYADDIVDYLVRQHILFPNGVTMSERDYLRSAVLGLLTNARLLRNGDITEEEFQRRTAVQTGFFDTLRQNNVLAIRGANFTNMLLTLPGFELTNTAMRNRARALINNALHMRNQVVDTLDAVLTRDVILRIVGILVIIALSPFGA